MQRTVLIIIIAVILIAIILGVYFLVFNIGSVPVVNQSSQQSQNTQQTPNSFEIQGMKVEVLKQGTGEAVKTGEKATVHYVGWLPDGKKFDSSVDRNAPFTFTLGENRVIKGWELGVLGMKVGEKRKLTIPPDLAYGSASFLSIPANATLTFEVELLGISR